MCMSFIAKTMAGVGNNTDRQESQIEYGRYVNNVIKRTILEITC